MKHSIENRIMNSVEYVTEYNIENGVQNSAEYIVQYSMKYSTENSQYYENLDPKPCWISHTHRVQESEPQSRP